MHAEMVTLGDRNPTRVVKVADAAEVPGARPRMFAVPQIDKSKAEDPYGKNPPPAASTATAKTAEPAPVAPAKPAPAARPVLKMPELSSAQELTRQQREMMLATSGPRKAGAIAKTDAERPAAQDYSRVQWGYSGLGAPEHWGRLAGGALCGSGKRQSPIDIRGGIRVDLEPIQFDYRPSQFRITDSGYAVQVDVAEGNGISVMGRAWQLTQIQFHRPSEERVNGKTYEMSMHFVHRDLANNIAVVAVLLERGPEHPSIQMLWNHLPLDTGLSVEPPNVMADLAKLLPERREYYTYMGSLTTPPCTENVLWMVFKEPILVSPEQIGIFARLYPYNARPIQPTHDRLIKESR
jgi:carbonic anhydrase